MRLAFNPFTGRLDYVGEDGGGSDANAVYEQLLPVTSDTIVHGLGKRAAVEVVSLAGKRLRSTVTWISDNAVAVEFNSPTSFRAYFN